MLGEAARGKLVDQMALNLDLAPTLLDLAGVEIPEHDARPQLAAAAGRRRRGTANWRTAFFYEYFFERNFSIPTVLAVRTDTAKLIKYPGHDEWTELFDLAADPYETKNLVARSRVERAARRRCRPSSTGRRRRSISRFPSLRIHCRNLVPKLRLGTHVRKLSFQTYEAELRLLACPSRAWARVSDQEPALMHLVLPLLALLAADAPARPNVVFILCDDLARGDLGCYGQKLIQTPNLDRMAAEGMRFTQAYCGTSVCAPSRSSLMTGLHMGHCPVRANRATPPEGQMPLPAGTYTVAKLFHDQGYATAAMGKWGMGMFDTTGSPLKLGFDHFFGYNCQSHAHSYFPTYLYNDDRRFELTGNDGMGVGKTYAQNLIADDMLAWVRRQKDKPFFLFLPLTLPHGQLRDRQPRPIRG